MKSLRFLRVFVACSFSILVCPSLILSQEWVPWTFETYDQWQPWEKVTEEQRKKWNKEYDRKGLYKKSGMAIDNSKKLIQIPKSMKKEWLEGIEIAKTPPTIEFAPVRGIDPMYFPEHNKSAWSNWGSVTLAPNGRFYFTEGDHRAEGSNIYLWEYDPVAHDYKRVIDFAHLCGWNERGVGDSKIHGDMGVMPDGTMWILTYWDPDPKPTLEQYAKWPGSHLVKFDTYTGRAKDMGVLIPKCGWPEYRLDTKRGILFAVGFRGEILCYDVIEERVKYAGFPPAGISWYPRCSLLDPETGLFWANNYRGDRSFISFDPQTNTFMKYPEEPPEGTGIIRSYSHRRSEDGSFWITTKPGHLYKFWPDDRRTEHVGHLWRDYTYAPRFAMSADGKYLYYARVPGQNQSLEPHPIFQYNTRTRAKKIIAFIGDYYFEKYGFFYGGPFGVALSQDGSTLVLNLNGAFKPRVEPFYGNPALMVVHIPESERP